MKTKFILLLIVLSPVFVLAQSVEITPGNILPKMTTDQRTGLSGAKDGMLVFDTNTQSYWYRKSGVWTELGSTTGSGAYWELSGIGNTIKNTNFDGFWSENFNTLNSEATDFSNPPTAPVNGGGTRLMWIPSRSAFRAGTVATGLKAWDADSIGLFSFATGFSTYATGKFSSSFGLFSKAHGQYSTALGNLAIAMGNASVAMGVNTSAIGYNSVTMGRNTKAFGDGSIAAGFSSHAIGYGSVAMGLTTKAEANGSFAIGVSTNATGTSSVAMGTSTTASEFSAVALGYGTEAIGETSTALGRETTASGTSSTAIGYQSKATGLYSLAAGQQTESIGLGSTALGNLTKSIGTTSLAVGFKSEASGGYSTAIGNQAKATKTAAFAVGNLTTASGNYSFASGSSAIASGESSTAMGAASHASGLNSTAMGNLTTASGDYAIAMGQRTRALANNSFTLGKNAELKSDATGSIYLADSYPTRTAINTQVTNDRFYARFTNGYFFFTDPNSNVIGAKMTLGQTAWSAISDSTLKENFIPANTETVLKSVSQIRIGTWNYKGQNPEQFRHWGVMAQDFYSHFGKDQLGTIGDDISINTADFDGVAFAALKGLEARTRELKKENERLLTEIESLKKKEKQNEEFFTSELLLIKQQIGLNSPEETKSDE